MAEDTDPQGLTYNGIRFADFCDECRDVLLALRARKIQRGEICQSCAWRLIAAAANPGGPSPAVAPSEQVDPRPVIDAQLARIMGRRIATKPTMEPPIADDDEVFGVGVPGLDGGSVFFDLRRKYNCALLTQAQAMADLLTELQWNEALGRFVPICPECGGLKPDGDVPPDPPEIGEHLWGHGKTCRTGKILAVLELAKALDGN